MNEIIRAARRGDINFLEENAVDTRNQLNSAKNILHKYHPDIHNALFEDNNNNFSTIVEGKTSNLRDVGTFDDLGFFD